MLVEAAWWMLRRLPPGVAYKIVHSTPYWLAMLVASTGGVREEYPLEFLGARLRNPVGLAAGLDKDGDLMWISYKLGFGFTVVGSIMPARHRGARVKVLKRLPDGSLINRLGLPSKGVDYAVRRLEDKPPIPVAANIASLTMDGYRRVYEKVHGLVDWVEVNVSCPNTEEHGTFEKPEMVERILSTLPHDTTPTLVKLPPVEDRELVREYAQVIARSNAAGAVVSNTLKVNLDGVQAGLSGERLYPVMIRMLRWMRELLPEDKVLVAVGGITRPERAVEALEYANAIEVLSALLYYGPGRVREIIEAASRAVMKR